MRFLFALVLELLHICGADSGSHYLAAVGLGQFLDELDNAGIFIRRCSVLDVVLYLLDKLFARLIALCEHDGRLDDLTSVGVRQSGDGAIWTFTSRRSSSFGFCSAGSISGSKNCTPLRI